MKRRQKCERGTKINLCYILSTGAAFEFKRKMQASAKSLWTLMVPLFNLADTIATIKDEAEHTLNECGAVVIP